MFGVCLLLSATWIVDNDCLTQSYQDDIRMQSRNTIAYTVDYGHYFDQFELVPQFDCGSTELGFRFYASDVSRIRTGKQVRIGQGCDLNYGFSELSLCHWTSGQIDKGFFRQCDFIDYTTDLDIGIRIEDFRPELVCLMEHHGLTLWYIFGQMNDSFELVFRDNEIKIDMFFFYQSDNYSWTGAVNAGNGQKFKYIFPKFTLCWTEFLTIKVRIPCQLEAYNLANYGINWTMPISKWDWTRSPPNIRDNGVWPKKNWPQVIQIDPRTSC